MNWYINTSKKTIEYLYLTNKDCKKLKDSGVQIKRTVRPTKIWLIQEIQNKRNELDILIKQKNKDLNILVDTLNYQLIAEELKYKSS